MQEWGKVGGGDAVLHKGNINLHLVLKRWLLLWNTECLGGFTWNMEHSATFLSPGSHKVYLSESLSASIIILCLGLSPRFISYSLSLCSRVYRRSKPLILHIFSHWKCVSLKPKDEWRSFLRVMRRFKVISQNQWHDDFHSGLYSAAKWLLMQISCLIHKSVSRDALNSPPDHLIKSCNDVSGRI